MELEAAWRRREPMGKRFFGLALGPFPLALSSVGASLFALSI